MPRARRKSSTKAVLAKAPKKQPAAAASTRPQKRARKTRDEREDQHEIPETSPPPSGDDGDSDAYEPDEVLEVDDALSVVSEDIDDSDFEAPVKKEKKGGKVASKAAAKKSPAKKSTRKRKRDEEEGAEDVLDDEEDEDLGPGYKVIGRVVEAPKTGRVPPGQVSKNTLDFLANLGKPECNDRTWFKLHEPVFRQAEKEWQDFVASLTDAIVLVDPQIPSLPPKDLIHRIYRDVRFSHDKTPYKQNFSASISRSGRKGIFAGYHFAIRANGGVVAAGVWEPGKNELATIRSHIQHDPTPLRTAISAPEFVKIFGEAKPHPKKERQNVFGQENELKTAPKGVDKNHPDIDLLKLRSIAVAHTFTKSEVLDPGFTEKICEVVEVMRPFIHCLNEMITVTLPPPAQPEDDE